MGKEFFDKSGFTNAGLANTVFDLRRENDVWFLRRVIVN